MDFSIVKFQPGHYVAVAAILSEIYPGHTFDLEGLRAQDLQIPAECKFERWIGLHGSAVVAFGEYRQTPEMHYPDRFTLHIGVVPEYQGRGYGSRLYTHVVSRVRTYRPTRLRATARADDIRGVAFLKRRGFQCDMRIQEWRLDLGTADSTQLSSVLDRIDKAGIHIQTVDDLGADPHRNRKLYDLICAIRQDAPLPEPATRVSFRQFKASFLAHPSYLPEAAFVAVQTREYIGYSDLREDGAGGLIAGLTGVRRDFRRQGVATALKLWGVRFGRLQGYQCIKTFAAAEDEAMQSINSTTGFIPRYEWMHFAKLEENGACETDRKEQHD